MGGRTAESISSQSAGFESVAEAAGLTHLDHVRFIGQHRIGIRALPGWRVGVGPV